MEHPGAARRRRLDAQVGRPGGPVGRVRLPWAAIGAAQDAERVEGVRRERVLVGPAAKPRARPSRTPLRRLDAAARWGTLPRMRDLFVGLCLVVAPAAAVADVIAPEEEACEGKQRGDACNPGDGAGTCQDGQCCRNDYSNGTPPRSVCGPCLRCQPAPAGSSSTSDDGGCAAGPSAPGGLGLLALLGGGALALGLARTRRRHHDS